MNKCPVHTTGSIFACSESAGITLGIGIFSTLEYPLFISWIGQISFTFSLLVYYWETFCHSGTKILGDCQGIPVWNIVVRGFWFVHWHALSPGEAQDLLPASLQLSQFPHGCPSFATPSWCLCDVLLWRSLSLELPYHCWSLPDFHGALQSSSIFSGLLWCSPVVAGAPGSLELLLFCQSCCFCAGVAAFAL